MEEVLVVRVVGEFDGSAMESVVAEVSDRATSETALVVVSLAAATDVRWNALCRLGRAVRGWRAARLDVVVEVTRCSLTWKDSERHGWPSPDGNQMFSARALALYALRSSCSAKVSSPNI